ncbi:30S ribosomal protein S15 [Methanosarcina sp. KYL-1]|uniref:30S ribosomal protein S15 n=1 Tax=Methanosarcina sp. KYL-1 TaxID=2602068 RepID=UPI002101C94A|nr:30S ribosomal protein S15 [Methanosarcina sp. KYL-1]MCQ1535449.1 30S ribosomal protein S15 [Methanosarcina sp. KYL-1]
MAKMHTRRKGKSCATRPNRTEAPEWCKMSAEEVTTVVLDLWKQGVATAEIGMILRDRYGVPDAKLVTGKKITTILKDNNVAPSVPEDLYNLIVKALNLRKHLSINKKDVHNRRSLQLTESKIRRLVKYYHQEKVLPKDWFYKPETAEMMITR